MQKIKVSNYVPLIQVAKEDAATVREHLKKSGIKFYAFELPNGDIKFYNLVK